MVAKRNKIFLSINSTSTRFLHYYAMGENLELVKDVSKVCHLKNVFTVRNLISTTTRNVYPNHIFACSKKHKAVASLKRTTKTCWLNKPAHQNEKWVRQDMTLLNTGKSLVHLKISNCKDFSSHKF